LESQLFGHLKGAFTGATETREGFFDAADRGSLFLDEISETTPATQVKLLRVLQDKEIYPVGATQARKVDVRVLAATNKDLSELIGKGSFREDLYYRLNVIAIEMPPLRDRNDDLQILIHHFARRFAAEYDVPEPHFTSEALKVLKSYYWPGNVRELENVIQRVVLMTEGDKIDFADLPPLLRATRQKAGLHRTLAEVEREHIREVLASVENNKTRAAEILGIDRKTLRSKLTRTSAPSSPAGDG
jgi:DNA-binding NtrC family response regulator